MWNYSHDIKFLIFISMKLKEILEMYVKSDLEVK